MIKTIEYNDGESRLQGAVEILERVENGTKYFTIKEFVEDKLIGIPHEFIIEQYLEKKRKQAELGVLNELKKMAHNLQKRTAAGRLSLKGYSDPD